MMPSLEKILQVISAAGFTVRNLKPVQKLFMEQLINL